MNLELGGKTALVTGSTRGIGRAIAGALHQAGAAVAVHGRDASKAGEVAAALGPRAVGVGAELTDAAQVVAAVERVERELGPVDILVNNAGLTRDNLMLRLSEADWDAVHSANIVGLYNTYEAARRQGCRRIVFATTNHVVGFYRRQRTIDDTAMPRPDSRYGVSKAFGEALGRMYADKYGLRVLNIRIGNVDHRPADVRRLSSMCLAIICRIGVIGSRRSPATGSASAFTASPSATSADCGLRTADSSGLYGDSECRTGAGFAWLRSPPFASTYASTSVLRTRPPIPVPWTCSRSTSCFSAIRRTTGDTNPERSVSPPDAS